jgi:hypothetical protein
MRVGEIAGLGIFEELESSVGEDEPPTDAIRGYVDELLARWPDITEDGGDNSPWADGPLIGNASGPVFVFSLGVTSLAESIPYCTEVARRRGIVLYDQEQAEVYSGRHPSSERSASPRVIVSMAVLSSQVDLRQCHIRSGAPCVPSAVAVHLADGCRAHQSSADI